MYILSILFEFTDAFPFTLRIFLPQRDLVVAARDGQHIAGQRPAHSPDHIRELGSQALLDPLRRRGILSPDEHRLILIKQMP